MENNDKWVSDCCLADVKVVGGDEGTNHWECLKCGKSCDAGKDISDSEVAQGLKKVLDEIKD